MNEEKKIVELNLDDILPNRFQPRIKFDEKAINELASSIKEHGVIQPILVRKMGDKYEIIAGERRYKASVIAGKETIPSIVNNLDDKESAEVALIENIQRKDLTPIEEAISYKKILDMGYLNQESLATKLDKTQSTISNKLRLLNLNEEIQEALLDNMISERHARSLLRVENKEEQNKMLDRIVAERLTVRQTDLEIDKLLNINEIIEDNRKGAIFMNNEEEKGVFNIPTSPIIEEIEIFDEFDQEFNQSTENENQNINTDTNLKPGFLDIEKIEQNAEEINTEKSPADLDSLLKIDDNMVAGMIDNNNLEPDDNDDDNIVHGKFFSYLDDKENNIESKPVELQFNNFDFDLTNANEEAIENTLEEDKIDNKEQFLSENNYENVSNEIQFETPTTDMVSDDNPSKNNIITEPDYNFNFSDLVTKPEISTPTSNHINYIEEESIPDYTIPGVDDQNLNNNNIKQFHEVLTEVRDYSKKIEEYGFFVEVDELDFGDIYQVTFKINKNQ
ncbi:MAG: ParB/RepB/Spo0J family partition protein [Bacilli bacterium]|nr:ParB/RepB/Spo0J family partition protein [Bacilli bacterium]MDD4282372.1 ParB/RepB/Spo0J family partition protein [Bacilli bacterium]MDD4718253.1 ParB/RepB/Spo0J family partition protein [Bacilli bacterium]